MNVLVLHKPLPQQHVKLDRNQARVLSLGFSPTEAEQIKDGDDLIFVFEDGARLTLVGYYADGTSPLPQFSLVSAAADEGITPLFSLNSNSDMLFDLSSKSASRASQAYSENPLIHEGAGTASPASPSSLSSLTSRDPFGPIALDDAVLDKLPLVKETHRYEMGHMAFAGGVDSMGGFDYAVNAPPPILSPAKPPETGVFKPEPPNNPPHIIVSPAKPDGLPAEDVVTLDIKERGVFGDDPAHGGQDPNAEHSDVRIADSVSGQLTATDLDLDALAWSLRSDEGRGLEIRTKFGTVTIDAQGRFVYRLDQDRVNGLNQGQGETDSFYVVVSDGRGGFDEQLVTVNIEGTNEAPELTLTGSGQHHLAARIVGSGPLRPLETSGELNVTDADADGLGDGAGGLAGNSGQADFSISCGAFTSTATGNGGAVIATPKGTLLVRPDGHYTFTADQSAIVPGTDESLTFTITVKDIHGSSDTVDITVRLTFTTNQPPIIGVLPIVSLKEDGVQNGGNTSEPGTITQSGSFVGFATDADGDALRYTITPPVGCTSVTVGDVQTITTPYGVLTLNTSTGHYTYTLNRDAALDKMTVGQKISSTFTLTVDDGYDLGVVSKPFTVEIEGTNDAPVLNFVTGFTGQHIGADGLIDGSGVLIRSGKLVATDVDADGAMGGQIDATTPKQQFCISNPASGRTSIDSTDGRAALQSEYGTLTIDKNGNYTFRIDPTSPKVLALGSHQTYVDEFTIFVRDAHGAISGSQVIRVQITGKDDPPIFLDSNYVLNLTESGRLDLSNTPTDGISLSTGNVRAESIDSDKSHHTLLLTLNTLGNPGVISNTTVGNVQTIVTKYGTLTLNTSTGAYTFALDNTLAAVQALGYADSVNMRFNITVTDVDDPSLSRFQNFTLTIKGTNDAPEISGVNPNGTLEEDPGSGAYTGTGRIVSSDADHPANSLTHSLVDTSSGNKLVSVLTGKYGWVEINANGTYTYHLDNDKAQALSSGLQGDTFTVRVMDARGAYTDKVVTIPITGKDDPPEITGGFLLDVHEDNSVDVNSASTPHPTVTGAVTSKDVDALDTDRLFEANGGTVLGTGTEAGVQYQDIRGTWGVLRLFANGTYRYTLTENMHGDIQKLNNGRHDPVLTDSFNIKLWSGHGSSWLSSDTGTITITIIGTNDSPVITAHNDLTIAHIGGVLQQVETGSMTVYDVDDTSHTYYFRGTDAGGNPIGLQSHAGTFGVLVVDRTTGKYTYTLNPFSPDFIALVAGSTGTDTFTVRVEDAHGGWVDQVITVTVHPFIPNTPLDDYLQHATDLTVTEDNYNLITTNVDASGTATMTQGSVPRPPDPDHVFGFLHNGFIATTVVGTYGSIVIDELGNYTYTLNNSMRAVQELGKHSGTLTESFQLWGAEGGASSDTITITINGTNDRPTVTSAQDTALQLGQVGGAIDPAKITVGGTVTSSDIDRGDTLTYWLKDGSGNLVSSYTVNDASGNALYSISINQTTGVYTFTYLSSKLLNRDETKSYTFSVVVKDNSGDANDTSDADSFTVKVNGVNTPPIITNVPSLAVTEDVTLNATANAVVTDDTGTGGLRYLLVDTLTSSATGTTLMAGAYGTLMITNPSTGQYKYVLNNSQTQVNELDENASLTETFYLKVWDKHGGWDIKPVTVTIQGTNDAPSLSLSTSNLSIYDGGGRVTGKSSVSDPDDSSGFVYSLQGAGVTTAGGIDSITTNYGTLYLNKSTGVYYFEVDNTSAAVQGLSEGQHVSLRTLGHNFKIYVTDNNGGGKSSGLMDVDVTVHGKDNNPVFSTQPSSVTVTGTTVSGSAAAYDPDYISGTTHYGVKYSIFYYDDAGNKCPAEAGTTLVTKYGLIVIDANGQYTYTLTDPAGLGKAETFYVSAKSLEPGYQDSTNSNGFTVYIDASATPRITRSAFRMVGDDDVDDSLHIAPLALDDDSDMVPDALPDAVVMPVTPVEPAHSPAPVQPVEPIEPIEPAPVASMPKHEPAPLFLFGEADLAPETAEAHAALLADLPEQSPELIQLLQDYDLGYVFEALPADVLRAEASESALAPAVMSSYNNPDAWENVWANSKPYVRSTDFEVPDTSLTSLPMPDLLAAPPILLDPCIVEESDMAIKAMQIKLENNLG